MSEKISQKTMIILGAGLAGLSAAYELSKNNYKVIILEKDPEVGGLAKTFEKDGFRFDTGPHRWFTKNKEIDKWFLDLLKDEVIEVPRQTRIYFDKKFFDYPIKIKNALQVGVANGIRSVLDYASIRIKDKFIKPKIVTMEDGYTHQFGQKLYKLFFKRYSEKLWGRKCSEISADWISQRTRGLNIGTIIKDAFFKSKNVVSLVDKFHYPKHGIGTLSERLKNKIIKNGGNVITEATITKVETEKRKIKAIWYRNGDQEVRLEGNEVVCTIPINDLIQIMGEGVPEDIKVSANKLAFRAEIQVALLVNKSHITKDNWIYVHPENICFVRLMEMDNWGGNLSPEGKTAIVFELACEEGDTMWNRSDEELANMVKREYIEEFNSVTEKDCVSYFVYRQAHEYPVYSVGYQKPLSKIKKYLKSFDNLQLAGRNGLFRYNNMDHAIETGTMAAKNIIEGKRIYDPDSVNSKGEYLEEKRTPNE